MLCKKHRYKTKKIFIPQPKHTTVQKETDENDNKENILLINENSKNQFNENEIEVGDVDRGLLGIGELLLALGLFVVELGLCVIQLFLGVAVDPVIPLVRCGLDQVFPYRAQPVHLLFIRVGVNDLIGVQLYIDIRIVFGAEGLSGQIHEAVDGAVPDRCVPSLEIDIEG